MNIIISIKHTNRRRLKMKEQQNNQTLQQSIGFATVSMQQAQKLLPREHWLVLGTIYADLAKPYPTKIFDRNK